MVVVCGMWLCLVGLSGFVYGYGVVWCISVGFGWFLVKGWL